MGKHLQLILGPAGSGKSTYCAALQHHFETVKRSAIFINLDPAAEHFKYKVHIDIRDFLTVKDVAEEYDFGPNGGLIFCLEQLLLNIDWLMNLMNEYGSSDDEYFVVDCPGQIETFTHNTVMKDICKKFKLWDIKVCGVYLLDSMFMSDPTKYLSGAMMALSTMIQLEISHVNVLSKCDLLNKHQLKTGNEEVQEGFEDDENEDISDIFRMRELIESVDNNSSEQYKRLHYSFCQLLQDYPMVNFIRLNLKNEESLEKLLIYVDNALQYGEDTEPTNPVFDKAEQVLETQAEQNQ